MGKRAYEPLGELVKRLRISRGLTQRDLANTAGYTSETIARLEQGRGQLSERSARAILQAIAKSGRIRMVEAEDFFVGSGLSSAEHGGGISAELMDWLNEHDMLLDPIARGPLVGVESPAHDALVADVEELRPLLLEAIERSDKQMVKQMLAVLARRPAADPLPDERPVLTHISPFDRDGLSGTIHTPYASKATASSSRKKGRRAAGA